MKRAEEAAWSGARLFDQQLSFLRRHLDKRMHSPGPRLGGITRWLSRQWQAVAVSKSPLAVVAKIQIGPRHSVALLEADGTRLLLATASDGAIAFHSLPEIAEEYSRQEAWSRPESMYSRQPRRQALTEGNPMPRGRKGSRASNAPARANISRISW